MIELLKKTNLKYVGDDIVARGDFTNVALDDNGNKRLI